MSLLLFPDGIQRGRQRETQGETEGDREGERWRQMETDGCCGRFCSLTFLHVVAVLHFYFQADVLKMKFRSPEAPKESQWTPN